MREGLSPRLGVLFLVLAGWNGWEAAKFGLTLWPFTAALGWLSVSLLGAGLAYAGAGPRVFAKRADGSRHPLAALALAPYLGLARFSWRLRVWSGEPCWHEVAPGLFLGRRARAQELPPGVNAVIDLTAEHTEPRGVREGRTYRVLSTLDGCAPDEAGLRALVADFAAWEGAVFIHCAVGRGRSSTVAAALLLARGLATSPEDAEARLRAVRPCVKLTRKQRAVLARLGSIDAPFEAPRPLW